MSLAIGSSHLQSEHTKGGHFPALDCPEEFVSDLREFFGSHWHAGQRQKL